jgi:hypothetical protein
VRLVILESPYGSSDKRRLARNIRYARACLRDSLIRGESPLASHLLYTQEGVLLDANPTERELGIAAGLAWVCRADATVVYTDIGVSEGMRQGIARARTFGRPVEERTLGADWDKRSRRRRA